MQNTKSKYKIKIVVILGAFVLSIVLIRILVVCAVNHRFESSLSYDKNLAYAKYYLEEDGYVYRYRAANFINNDAFASVVNSDSQKLYMDENGELLTDGLQITLYMWPLKDSFGLDFYEKTVDDETSIQIYINLKKECLTENLSESERKYIDELIKDNADEIDNLIEKADILWHIKN